MFCLGCVEICFHCVLFTGPLDVNVCCVKFLLLSQQMAAGASVPPSFVRKSFDLGKENNNFDVKQKPRPPETSQNPSSTPQLHPIREGPPRASRRTRRSIFAFLGALEGCLRGSPEAISSLFWDVNLHTVPGNINVFMLGVF